MYFTTLEKETIESNLLQCSTAALNTTKSISTKKDRHSKGKERIVKIAAVYYSFYMLIYFHTDWVWYLEIGPSNNVRHEKTGSFCSNRVITRRGVLRARNLRPCWSDTIDPQSHQHISYVSNNVLLLSSKLLLTGLLNRHSCAGKRSSRGARSFYFYYRNKKYIVFLIAQLHTRDGWQKQCST